MATFRVNPNSSTNGSGTISDPYNTWASVTFSSGNTYLQDSGTIWKGRINIPVGVTGVYLGAYGAGPRPKIDADTNDRCIFVNNTADNGTIDGFEFYGANAIRLVSIGQSDTLPAHGWTIKNCYFHDNKIDLTQDSNGLQVFGNDHKILYNIFENISCDALWMQGTRFIVKGNYVSNIGLDNRQNGDCMQFFGNATLPGGNWLITDNYLDHGRGAFKQAIIVTEQSGASNVTVQNNICIMPIWKNQWSNQGNVIFADVVGAVIRGNLVRGGKYGIYCQQNNVKVHNNVVIDSEWAITQSSAITGMDPKGNTIVNAQEGIYADNDTGVSAQGNILVNIRNRAIGLEGGSSENYNCFWNCFTNVSSLGGGTPTSGGNSITENPKLTPSMTPTNPNCLGVVPKVTELDFNQNRRRALTNMGAIETYPARTVGTRTISRRAPR